LFAILIGISVFLAYRYYTIERFEDPQPPAVRGIDKVLHRYKLLEKQLGVHKVTGKDNLLENARDDLTEKRRLYILKSTNEPQVTYDDIRVALTRYITIFNKMVIDYNLDLLNMTIEDILAESPYIEPTITTPVYKSSDTYTGKT